MRKSSLTDPAMQAMVKKSIAAFGQFLQSDLTLDQEGYLVIQAPILLRFLNQKTGRKYCCGLRVVGDLNLTAFASLSGAVFQHCLFEGEVNATGVRLYEANFRGSRFSRDLFLLNADIRCSNFSDCFIFNFHSNEKTRRGKLHRKYDTNANTVCESITYHFGKKRLRFHQDAVFVDDAALTQASLRYLLSAVLVKYRELRSAEFVLWRQRGDQESSIKKLGTNAAQLKWLAQHGEGDPTSKTREAIVHALDTVAQVSAVVTSDDELKLFFNVNGTLNHGAVVANIERFLAETDKFANGSVSAAILESAIQAAEKLIEAFIRPDWVDSKAPYEEFQHIAASCALLHSIKAQKKVKNVEAAYDKLFSIYFHEMVLKKTGQARRCISSVETLVIVSGHFSELRDLIPSHYGDASASGFFCDSPRSKTAFQKYCEIQWVKTPLSKLPIDPVILTALTQQMPRVREATADDQLRIEKLCYLLTLIQHNKTDIHDAQLIIGSLRVAWPHCNFQLEIEKIIKPAVQFFMCSEMSRIALLLPQDAMPTHPIDNECEITQEFDQRCFQWEQFFAAFSKAFGADFSGINSEFRETKKTMLSGIGVTCAAINVLVRGGLISHREIKQLSGVANRPFVWMGSDKARERCLSLYNTKVLLTQEPVNKKIINGLFQITQISILASRYFTEDKSAFAVVGPAFVATTVRAITSSKEFLRQLHLTLIPVFSYDAIQSAVQWRAEADVFDANNKRIDGRCSIVLADKPKIKNPKTNGIKLEKVHELLDKLNGFEQALNKDYQCQWGDDELNRIQEELLQQYAFGDAVYTAEGLLYVTNMRNVMRAFRGLFRTIQTDLGWELSKEFGNLITAASANFNQVCDRWEQDLARVCISDAQMQRHAHPVMMRQYTV